jgi:ABC-2 type transport system permease protein
MSAALRAELVKLAASLVGRAATVAVVAGTTGLAAVMLWAVRSGDPGVVAKLGTAATDDWNGYIGAATQVTGAGGLLGAGLVLGWMVGREFSDRAIHGLFALPIGRATLVGAKLLAFGIWAAAVAVTLPTVLVIVGALAGLGTPDEDALRALARLAVVSAAGALLATPVALAATLGRSVLAPVGVSVALLVVAEVSVIAGAGGWMPLAAPTLWAVTDGVAATLGQTALVIPFAAVWVGASLLAWHRLQLDR